MGEAGDWLRRMQKSLDQMNVRVLTTGAGAWSALSRIRCAIRLHLWPAVSDIDGTTGMAILRAIAAGERDAEKLARFRDPHCKKSEKEIAGQLTGHWREDHVFSLRQALKMYDAIQEPMREAWYRMSGVDLTGSDAIGVETTQVVLSEYGPDLSCFPTEKQFVPHATPAPRRPTSGGKPLKKKKRNSAGTRVAAALRMAALSQRHSETAPGACYRHIARRTGGDVAVFATAGKLAIYIYRLLRRGQRYTDEGAQAFEKRFRDNSIKSLTAKAKTPGYQLQPANT